MGIEKNVESLLKEIPENVVIVAAVKSRKIKETIKVMSMSDSYQVAVEKGANIVRIGTKIFGPRNYEKN